MLDTAKVSELTGRLKRRVVLNRMMSFDWRMLLQTPLRSDILATRETTTSVNQLKVNELNVALTSPPRRGLRVAFVYRCHRPWFIPPWM
jgi:hypothetical protein